MCCITIAIMSIYCFSNDTMPGVVKIGFTDRSPKERLKEANSCTWAAPHWKMCMAKRVIDGRHKEKLILNILAEYHHRIHPKRELFTVSLDTVRCLFDLTDGEMLENEDDEEDDEEIIKKPLRCRELSKVFTHGQRLRHVIGITKILYAKYDASKNAIISEDGRIFRSLSEFSGSHYESERPDRSSSSNGWRECECETDDGWVSTYNLPEQV